MVENCELSENYSWDNAFADLTYLAYYIQNKNWNGQVDEFKRQSALNAIKNLKKVIDDDQTNQTNL